MQARLKFAAAHMDKFTTVFVKHSGGSIMLRLCAACGSDTL